MLGERPIAWRLIRTGCSSVAGNSWIVRTGGTLEIVKQLKLDPAQIADYKNLPEKFKDSKKKDEAGAQGAMLPDSAPKLP